MNKIPIALKSGHRKGFVALDPEGVRAIAQGNALCHRVFPSPSPEWAQANNITTGLCPFRAFDGNDMGHRALPCAIAPTPSGSRVTARVVPAKKHLISFKFKQTLIFT
jgi:hypothetical protein